MTDSEKRGSTNLAIKAGLWYVISTFLVKGLSFITTPVFSRLMSKGDYGEFSNFASWQATLLIIVGAELYNTINRAYYDFSEDFDGYVSTVTITSCMISATLYVLALIGGDYVLSIIAIPKEFIHVLFFVLTFQACKQIYLARERTLYRYKSVAAMSVCNLIIPTLIAVVLVMLSEESSRLSARIYGFYIPSALIGAMCAYVILKRSRKYKFEYCKYAMKLSLPLIANYLSAHLLTSSNTIVTKNVLGSQAVSTVSMSSSANHILTILLQSVSGAVSTWLMDNLNQQNIKAVRKGTLLYVAGVAAVSVGVMLMSPEVIWILGGAKYADSVYLMPGMVVSAMVQSISTIFTIILTYEKKVVKTALYTSIVSVVCILSKMFLLPVFGVIILPFINICCFGTLTAVNYYLVVRAGYGKYINIKGILAVIGFTFVIMGVSYYLYKNTILRYAVIGIMAVAAAVIMYKYRNIILKLINRKLKRKKTNPEE
ncbi:MAG: oligosaccharide flippase family protein [Eubacteriaceae bacterium]|nr:oligosaccharide flippase family protein [Eubacteriaceae bacterium]